MNSTVETPARPRARAIMAAALGAAAALGIFAAARRGTRPDARRLACDWLAAVDTGDGARAIAIARELAGPAPPGEELDAAYVELARSEGIPGSFLHADFNGLDLQLWRDAFFFRRTARELAPGGGAAELFAAVTGRVEPVGRGGGGLPWPREVWRRRWGLCDRQAWVLCELAYQLGWDVQVVYLRDPRTKESPHTICELRRGEEVVFADPFMRKMVEGRSIEGVSGDAELLGGIWPDHPRFGAALAGAVLWTPGYAQDYCPRNRRLAARLSSLLGGSAPRFGEDPRSRLRRYAGLRRPGAGGPPPDMGLWFYPFRLLAAQLRGMDAREGGPGAAGDHRVEPGT